MQPWRVQNWAFALSIIRPTLVKRGLINMYYCRNFWDIFLNLWKSNASFHRYVQKKPRTRSCIRKMDRKIARAYLAPKLSWSIVKHSPSLIVGVSSPASLWGTSSSPFSLKNFPWVNLILSMRSTVSGSLAAMTLRNSPQSSSSVSLKIFKNTSGSVCVDIVALGSGKPDWLISARQFPSQIRRSTSAFLLMLCSVPAHYSDNASFQIFSMYWPSNEQTTFKYLHWTYVRARKSNMCLKSYKTHLCERNLLRCSLRSFGLSKHKGQSMVSCSLEAPPPTRISLIPLSIAPVVARNASALVSILHACANHLKKVVILSTQP